MHLTLGVSGYQGMGPKSFPWIIVLFKHGPSGQEKWLVRWKLRVEQPWTPSVWMVQESGFNLWMHQSRDGTLGFQAPLSKYPTHLTEPTCSLSMVLSGGVLVILGLGI